MRTGKKVTFVRGGKMNPDARVWYRQQMWPYIRLAARLLSERKEELDESRQQACNSGVCGL